MATGTGIRSKENNSLKKKRQSDMAYSGYETNKISKYRENNAVFESFL
jgi:hypothetical protein